MAEKLGQQVVQLMQVAKFGGTIGGLLKWQEEEQKREDRIRQLERGTPEERAEANRLRNEPSISRLPPLGEIAPYLGHVTTVTVPPVVVPARGKYVGHMVGKGIVFFLFGGFIGALGGGVVAGLWSILTRKSPAAPAAKPRPATPLAAPAGIPRAVVVTPAPMPARPPTPPPASPPPASPPPPPPAPPPLVLPPV